MMLKWIDDHIEGIYIVVNGLYYGWWALIVVLLILAILTGQKEC